jgi:hypothetical protein
MAQVQLGNQLQRIYLDMERLREVKQPADEVAIA